MMGSLAPLAASSLLALVVRATILLSAALALAWLARRGPAGVRHLLWTITFALLLGLPVFSFLGLSWEVPIVPSASTTTEQRFPEIHAIQAGADGVVPLPASEPLLPVAGSPRQVPVGEPGSPARSIPRPLLLWAVGCAIGLTSLALGGVRFARLVRTASPVRDQVLIRQAEALRQRLGIHNDVRLLVSQVTATPMTGGLLRRVILFPASAAEWSRERWRVVLMHEMVHVRRRDVLRHLMGRTVLALYWFHPLSWVATMLAATASEEACDEEVLTLGTRPSEYAAHLLALAGSTSARRPVLTLPMSQQTHSRLERRIMAILTPFRPGRSRIGTALMVMAISCTGVSAAIVQPVTGDQIPTFEGSINLRIGEVEGEDPYLFTWVPSVATDPDGRVIVIDQGSHQVRVFDRDGRFLFHFGGPGEGPGEMEWPPCCAGFAPDDRLWVRERFRYHAFVLDEGGARYEEGLIRRTGHRSAPITFDSTGRLIDVGSIVVGGRLVGARFHMGPGTAVDTVHVGTVEEQLTGRAWFTEGRMMTLVEQPYGPRWLVAHGPGGAWGVASSSEYSVTLHQPDGNTLQIDGPPGPGPALTTSERDSAQADLDDQLERLRGGAPFGVPDHKPPLANIFFDRGGRLWVEKTAVRGDEMREADVYDEGVLVARYRWPRHVDLGHLPWVTASALYGTTRDELDVVRVVRVRFEPARSD